ncbi:MAG: phosphotransferase [Phycisphaerales bacterium]|nr:phosphotransferase [Phycisphaerales bacterium]
MTAPAPSSAEQPDGPLRCVLGADECLAVLDAYGLLGISGVRRFNKGNPAAPKALIEADSGRFLLKRRAPGLDEYARVKTEHTAQIALQREGRPVPAPLATRDGETIAVHQRRLYELYPFIDAEPWSPGVETAHAAGGVLAGLHDTFDRMGHAGESPAEDPGRVVRAFAHLGTIAPELRHALERLRHDWESARAHTESLALPPARLTHGDFHPGNTLWRGQKVVAVVDFETMRLDPFIKETPLAALYFALDTVGEDPEAWPDSPDVARLESFWNGYGAAERFEPALIEAAPWIMIEGLIAEALPRACRNDGFRRRSTGEVLPFIARTAAWIAEHADGLGVVLLQSGH